MQRTVALWRSGSISATLRFLETAGRLVPSPEQEAALLMAVAYRN
jgi:hypothetical protein